MSVSEINRYNNEIQKLQIERLIDVVVAMENVMMRLCNGYHIIVQYDDIIVQISKCN